MKKRVALLLVFFVLFTTIALADISWDGTGSCPVITVGNVGCHDETSCNGVIESDGYSYVSNSNPLVCNDGYICKESEEGAGECVEAELKVIRVKAFEYWPENRGPHYLDKFTVTFLKQQGGANFENLGEA